jgi:hypothetical protein
MIAAGQPRPAASGRYSRRPETGNPTAGFHIENLGLAGRDAMSWLLNRRKDLPRKRRPELDPAAEVLPSSGSG